ncbi:type II toxin-antitoxin system VapC family toxin [Halovivax limisalsi]|uniref:type II toxin-antitoxin system VapC family toxin n=1 Tax=Halovivax limisalsi TaxID=1453760 RepID=UPI001FFCA627|nr:type II toxin-antitoxin system VapC family toxin [Halovivax limisalsi]
MSRYTVDAVAFIRYLVDSLPPNVDEIFRRAEAGDATLYLPTIAAIESLYRIHKRDEIAGVPIGADATTIVDQLETNLPLTVVDHGSDELPVLAPRVPELSIHDAMIVSTHERLETDAILSSDAIIADNATVRWE